MLRRAGITPKRAERPKRAEPRAVPKRGPSVMARVEALGRERCRKLTCAQVAKEVGSGYEPTRTALKALGYPYVVKRIAWATIPEDDKRLLATLTVYCRDCPEWSATAMGKTAGEVYAEHRRTTHAESVAA